MTGLSLDGLVPHVTRIKDGANVGTFVGTAPSLWGEDGEVDVLIRWDGLNEADVHSLVEFAEMEVVL